MPLEHQDEIDEVLDRMQDHADRADLAFQAAKKLCMKWTLLKPEYVERLEQRLLAGTCSGAVEAAILRIALGKD